MKLKIVATVLSILISCFGTGTPVYGAEKAKSKTIKTKSARKIKNKSHKRSAFDPSDFIQNKQAHDVNRRQPDAKKTDETVTIGDGVVCNPMLKQRDFCTGPDCKQKVPVNEQPLEPDTSESLINDNVRLTNAVIKTIRENCAAVQDSQPFVKPVFEVGIKEPATGNSNKKEIIPKVGIQATF